MSEKTRSLFEMLQAQILDLDANVVELAETKSISYFVDDFFVEVLPRRRALQLLLSLDFAECHELDDQATDASERSFVLHAKHEGGVVYVVRQERHLEGAMRLVRQAYELALG